MHRNNWKSLFRGTHAMKGPSIRLLLLGLALLAPAAAGRAQDEGLASALAILPTSQQKAQAWLYVTEAPPAGWEKPDFNDASWKKGPGGFGTRGTPGAEVRTEWRTSDIWLRQTFKLASPPTADARLLVHHDDDAEIYLNGVLAAKLGGCTVSYEAVPIQEAARKALKAGKNTIAVHCHQEEGDRFVDVALLVENAAR